MGPSTRIDGDWRRGRRGSLVANGFNGAVDSHRRRRARPVRSRFRLHRFNGAVDSHRRRQGKSKPDANGNPMLQWGRRLASTETSLDEGDHQERHVASMGPSTRIDGDTRSTHRIRQSRSGFNGAVDSHRRRPSGRLRRTWSRTTLQWGRRLASTETCPTCTSTPAVMRLQWGRRLASTETRWRARDRSRARSASMGPSTRIDGDFMNTTMGPGGGCVLQWGRRLASTETWLD